MSTSTQPQSHDTILNTFHEITGLAIDDCATFLEQYHWKLQDILDDYYKKKDFTRTLPDNDRKQTEKNRHQPIPNAYPNLGDFYTKTNPKLRAIEDTDRDYALILAKYGDADERARQYRIERHQPQYYRPSEHPSKGNDPKDFIYHEKQELRRCGIHSLNNLFQIRHLFTPEHLDGIIREFDKNHIHNDYGTFWVGDYDLRILIEAIHRIGYQVRQINFYNGESLQNLPWDSYFGLLININGNHWFTIKNVNGIYYNLDSTFSSPSKIGQKNDLVHYLIRLIQKFQNLYIFIVSQEITSRYHS